MSLTDDLEKLGESEVRKRLINGGLGSPGSQNYCSVQEWLRGKELQPTNFPVDTDVIDRLAAILEQKAHEAGRNLDETIGRLHGEMRDVGAFHGSASFQLTKKEYEKDLEDRCDIFLSLVKQTASSMSREQRRNLSPAISRLARQWLSPHASRLQRRLQDLDAHPSFQGPQMLDLGLNRLLKAIDAQVDIILDDQAVRPNNDRTFVDPERLRQLRSIKNSQHDLSRLIRLCEELDITYTQECYQAVALLTRAILDHIPPIFGKDTFAEIANNRSGGRSFREMATHLENSSRKVADALLHTPIRKSESLPTGTQVDVRQQIDFVLGEVVRILADEQ